MNMYRRYASGEHDKEHFTHRKSESGHIKLRPLSGQFDVLALPSTDRGLAYWESVFPQAAFFAGQDPVLFGDVLTILHKNDATNKICAVSVTKFGCNVYDNLIVDSSSRFWPACENLSPQHRTLNVRKALAIVNLKNYNKLWNNMGTFSMAATWDETNAGSLASAMNLVSSLTPAELGATLLSLGLLQQLEISSLVVDVVYSEDERVMEENNSLVALLGTQIDQLFDPLLEYSPQAMDFTYTPPAQIDDNHLHSNAEIANVIDELLNVQTNYTMDLINLLQDFIVPLRAHVLSETSHTTQGAVKVNVAFPPTIDEVARINCILNNSLKTAAKFGCCEVFKVFAAVIPFFYKAFARHQAAVAAFHSRYEKFLKHNEEYCFDNANINIGAYTAKSVENLILGSIFELPKLKLIIQRLHTLVHTQHSVAQNFDSNQGNDELLRIDEHYRTIIETIDSLGCDASIDNKSRIFTPSGKLLTELATSWPEELQYGWMTRKVLAIHELRSTTSSEKRASEILIIFSDHALFLLIDDDDGKRASVMLPDVLMNSLINQKALPKLSNFPQLKVKFWCDIKNLLLKSYETPSGQFLTFLAYGSNSMKLKNCMEPITSLSYAMPHGLDSVTACNDIMSHVCKAQILNKSTPFHLFKYSDQDLNRFYCAQEYGEYELENTKSVIALFLNMDEESMNEMFSKNPQILIALSLSYLNEHTVHILGCNREKSFEVNEIVSIPNLSSSLKDILSRGMDVCFHSSSFINVLVEANTRNLRTFMQHLGTDKTNETGGSEAVEVCLKYPEAALTKTKVPDSENIDAKRLKSRLLALFLALKRKNLSRSEPQRRAVEPHSGIPKGKKTSYKKLYKPAPLLREASNASSIVSQDGRKNMKTPLEVPFVEQAIAETQSVRRNVAAPRVLSGNTFASSNYSGESMEALPNFRFPNAPELENIQEYPDDYTVNGKEPEVQRDSTINSKLTKGSQTSSKFQPRPQFNSMDERIPMSEQLLTFCDVNATSPVTQVHVARDEEMTEPRDDVPEPKQPLDHETGKSSTSASKESAARGTTSSIGPREGGQALSIDSGSKSALLPKVQPGKIPEIKQNSRELRVAPRIASAMEVTESIEHMNSTGVSPQIYAKYKMYEELPVSIVNDEEANWTAMTRDSSSNLQAEIEAMQREKRKISQHVPLITSVLKPMMLEPPVQQFDSSDDTCLTFEMVTYVQEPIATHYQPKLIYDLDKSKENSCQSLNSAYVSSFGRQLEKDFSLASPEMVLHEFPASESETLRAEPLHRSESHLTICAEENRGSNGPSRVPSSSDEEYFSSQEFGNALDFWEKDGEEETLMLTLSSSEKTLRNEYFASPQLKQHVWSADDELENFGSMVYLSDILNGRLQI